MENEEKKLPWEALKHSAGNIPWSALSEFAAAVVRDESLTDSLLVLYDQAYESDCNHAHYEEYYIPVIFALASPQLSDERRSEIGTLLIEELVNAGYDDADLSLEVLSATCGSMGPAILPAVLEAIENEPDTEGAWFHLWGLTELAAKSEDAEIRASVVKACTDLLQRTDHGDVDPFDAISAAWTLSQLKCTESVELLKRVKARVSGSLCQGDYAEALALLQDRPSYTPPTRSWELPVKDWFEPMWRMARDWYAKQTHESGVDEIETDFQRIQELAGKFVESPEAAELGDDVLEDAEFIAGNVLKYAWDYVGSSPEELDESVLSEVLLDLLPRKVTAERDYFEKVAPVTAAFLKYLESEGILTDTAGLVEIVRSWTDTIVANGMNSNNWGPAKTFAMRALADGVDMGDREAVQQCIAEYNRRFLDNNLAGELESPVFAPRTPIVEHSPRIGRNEPCPCGSGRKYKKCCGGVQKADVHDREETAL